MWLARRHVAARNVLAALVATWVLPAGPACADGGPQLVLPLVAAIAAAKAAGSLPETGGRTAWSGPRGRLPFLPKQLQIPDVYAEAERDFIDVDRTRAPVDGDRYVWIDLFPRRYRGWMASVAYDEESQDPMPHSSDLVSFVLDYRF